MTDAQAAQVDAHVALEMRATGTAWRVRSPMVPEHSSTHFLFTGEDAMVADHSVHGRSDLAVKVLNAVDVPGFSFTVKLSGHQAGRTAMPPSEKPVCFKAALVFAFDVSGDQPLLGNASARQPRCTEQIGVVRRHGWSAGARHWHGGSCPGLPSLAEPAAHSACSCGMLWVILGQSGLTGPVVPTSSAQ